MRIWWLHDTSRIRVEREAVEALAAESGWFALTRWTVNAFRFSAEGVITAHGVPYPVRLVYPDQFPFVPAWVEPQDDTVRWSDHQYGRGGILCLELRPDNWSPSATGADVLRSAFNLLRTENPLGEGAKERVPSGHRIGEVQRYDWGMHPVLIGAGCRARLIEGVSKSVAALRWSVADGVWPILVFDADDREKPQHPPSFDLGTFRTEIPVVVGRAAKSETIPEDRDALAAMLGIELAPETQGGGLVAIALEGDALRVFHSPDLASVFERNLFVLPDEIGMRSGRGASAAGKKVAIVGVGSVGSKMAEALLRSGILEFVLVDGDVMLPGNLERHILDWRDVGFRKAEAVRRRLRHIVPGATVHVIPANLNWQRSAQTHADQIQSVADCDLIIDATGDAPTSLLLGALAAENGKAFLSAAVFEGGLGCLIARSMPGRDPPYALGRLAYHAFCEERAVKPPPSGRRGYEALSESGEPIVADDAAVGMAAAYAARVALDILDDKLGPDDTAWLLIGMREGWLFRRLGDVVALDVGGPPPPSAPTLDLEMQMFALQIGKEAIDEAKASR